MDCVVVDGEDATGERARPHASCSRAKARRGGGWSGGRAWSSRVRRTVVRKKMRRGRGLPGGRNTCLCSGMSELELDGSACGGRERLDAEMCCTALYNHFMYEIEAQEGPISKVYLQPGPMWPGVLSRER